MNINRLKDSSELITYSNPDIPLLVSKGMLSSFSNLEALCHWHIDVEFLMPLKGHISYNVNGKNLKVHENEAIFINSKQMHHGFSSDGSDCEYLCIVFNPNVIFSFSQLQHKFVDPITKCGTSEYIIRPDSAQNKNLLQKIHDVYFLYEKNSDMQALELLSSLYELWSVLFESSKSWTSNYQLSTDKNLDILKKMLLYIYDHYEDSIQVSDISSIGDICRSRCFQIFSQYLKITPNDFLISYRIEKSTQLLRDINHSISEVAYSCGFASSSYYTETFVKLKGYTPSEFRKIILLDTNLNRPCDFVKR